MVTVGSNLGAREAVAKNVADLVAPTLPVLLERIDGMKTEPKGLTLHTAGAEVEEVQLSGWKRLLDLLVDPNVIALMLSIGLIGLVVELWNPGLVLPGTVGAISLVVGLYGLQVLPVSAAGILLLLLAAGLFVAELFVVSHGALTLAGAVCFVIGSLMLFDPAGPAYQVSLQVAVGIAARWRSSSASRWRRRRRPAADPLRSVCDRLVGDEATCGATASSSSAASSGRRARSTATPSCPASTSVSTPSTTRACELVVGSASVAARKELIPICRLDRHRRRRRLRAHRGLPRPSRSRASTSGASSSASAGCCRSRRGRASSS